MQRDVYGNIFYYNNYNYRNFGNSQPEPIATGKLLGIRPSDGWLGLLVTALQPKFSMLFAQLLLKVGEEDEAFPYIETLAATHPEQAESLVGEFLRVWAENHDPNSETRRTSSYMFIYGFDMRANAIPLTRSKQERNLEELAHWVERLRALPLETIDEKLLARAFTAAHSAAEVYRVESFEKVFGSLEGLGADTLAELVQTMRGSLGNAWRQPALQKDNKTKRRQKDIQSEVLRGYDTCRTLCTSGLEQNPGHWKLQLALAAVAHDEVNYQQEIQKSSEFSHRRREALAQFQEAAVRYAETLPSLKEEEQSSQAYETWFYASLGASDLQAIDHESQLVEDQIEGIRTALLALPGEAADHHVGMFANNLFTRMSSVNPAVKFRYVRAGLEIVGDDERAKEARDVHEYYSDLVTERIVRTSADLSAAPARSGGVQPREASLARP